MHIRASRSGLLLAATLSFALPARATLYDRGGGLLYDDVLNVTWLQDANYAKTSGYDADGMMNWWQANTWAANLVYGGYDDWRLVSTNPVGGTWNINYSTDGSTDKGFNITSPNSELAYMYYVNLGLKGYYSPTGVYQPNFGIFGDGTYNGQNNVGLVRNLQSYVYWTGTAFTGWDVWAISTSDGQQYTSGAFSELYAWAVRPGDVAAPVPEPETYAMLLAGIGLVGAVARRKRQAAA